MRFDRAGPFLRIAFLIGVVSEGLLMSLVLRGWTHDVGHLKMAFALRRAYKTKIETKIAIYATDLGSLLSGPYPAPRSLLAA